MGAGSSGVAICLNDGSDDYGEVQSLSTTAFVYLEPRLMLSCIFLQAAACVENYAPDNWSAVCILPLGFELSTCLATT